MGDENHRKGRPQAPAWIEQRILPQKQKAPRAVLPHDDAEDSWKPGVSTTKIREPRTLLKRMPESSTKPRGQALIPDELVSI